MADTSTTSKPTVTPTSDVQPVLTEHTLDETRLADYLSEHIDGFRPPLSLGQCMGGMSNPTFVITDATGKRYILRKKPTGPLLPSAHAVDREYRVISALGSTNVPVPETYTLCEDDDIIGQAFYVMGFEDGRVFRNLTLPGMAADDRAAIYAAMGDTLAKLHAVDTDAVGLASFGRVGGYAERQVARWSKQYEAQKTEDLADMNRLMTWLPENMPAEAETTLVHGDFRLENMIFHPTEAKVLAVVDWELSTLGDPLSDLAYNCLPYYMPDPNRGDLIDLTSADGIPAMPDHVAAYSAATGRNAEAQWTFYVVLSLFRIAAIVQGVYYRGLQGNASSPEALKRKDSCRNFSRLAWQLAAGG